MVSSINPATLPVFQPLPQTCQRLLCLDVSGLLIYARDADTVTGIQRVELSFIRFLIRHEYNFEIVCAFDIAPSRLLELFRQFIDEPDALLREVRSEWSRSGLRSRRYGWIRSLWHRWRPPFSESPVHVRPGSILLVLGSFWSDPAIITFYQTAAKADVFLLIYIYDVIPVLHREFACQGTRKYFEELLRLPISVLTPTISASDDIHNASFYLTGSEPRSVQVLPLAHQFYGDARNSICCDQSMRLKKAIRERRFALCVGTVDIRKNHRRLIRVWSRLSRSLQDDMPLLIIAGKRGRGADVTLSYLDEANRQDLLADEPFIFIEEPSETELRYLYSQCEFTIFPSLLEGWGLPVGESLWFGKPCAASSAAPIPEVGRDLCVYFDPIKDLQIETAVRTLIDRTRRDRYREKIRTAALRNWDDFGYDLLRTLDTLPIQSCGVSPSSSSCQNI